MISVVIPLYNKSEFVQKTIQSVASQIFTEFELVIIDDGSTDNSYQIAQQAILSVRQPTILLKQENAGVSAARNTGVKASNFNYIAFLDADDWWAEDFLAEMAKLICTYPEAAIYGSKYYWVKNGRMKVSLNHMPDGYVGYIDYIKAYTYAWWMPLTSISIVVQKQAFWKVGAFNDTLKFGEDFDLWIRLVLNYKLAYINKPLAYYNQDVPKNNRAVTNFRIYEPSSSFLFNTSYLRSYENQKADLKVLLDGLRVRSLIPYRLTGSYKTNVDALLNEIDFNHQPAYYRFIYQKPVVVVRFYFLSKQYGSALKQFLLRIISK